MIVARSTHPDWLSNAYLVADRRGGSAVIVDAGAPIEPLLAAAEEHDVRVTHVLLTHEHHDHTQHLVPLEERFGATIVLPGSVEDGHEVVSGGLALRALLTPGHCEPHVAWLASTALGDGSDEVFTGDVLFRGTVGGTVNGGADGLAKLRASLLDVLMALDDATVVRPGHMEATTVGAERTDNPFVRALRGDEPLGDEAVEVAGSPATLLLEGPDYDGGTKAWIRFADGREAIVGGSMVARQPRASR